MSNVGSILVSWDFSHGKDAGILLVERVLSDLSVEMINIFQDKEAEELYSKLTAQKEDR